MWSSLQRIEKKMSNILPAGKLTKKCSQYKYFKAMPDWEHTKTQKSKN